MNLSIYVLEKVSKQMHSKDNLECMKEFDAFSQLHSQLKQKPKFKLFSTYGDSETELCVESNSSSSCTHKEKTIDPGGFIVCSTCSTVIMESYAQSSQWANDTFGERDRRGPIQTNNQLGTIPAGNWRDRRKLTSMMVTSCTEKSVAKYHRLIEMICSQFDISQNIIEEACGYYSKVDSHKRKGDSKRKEGVIRGNRLVGLIAACVLQASEKKSAEYKDQMSLTELEVSKMFRVDKEYVSHGIKDLKKLLFIETPDILISKSSPLDVRKMRVANYIGTFAERMSPSCEKDEVKITSCDVNCAIHVSNKLLDYKITNKCTPTSTAATAITLVKLRYDLPIKRSEITKVCKVSDVTINKILKIMREEFKRKGATPKTPVSSPVYDILFPDQEQILSWKTKFKNDAKTFKSGIISVVSETR